MQGVDRAVEVLIRPTFDRFPAGVPAIGLEDMARIRGLEETLRNDLSMAMGDRLDKSVLQGGASLDIPGFLHTLTGPANPSAIVTLV